MIIVHEVNEHVLDVPRIKIDKTGLTFVTTIVAFLLVSRVTGSLERYNKAHACLTTMFRESREFMQQLCVYSMGNTDPIAKEWRHEVAYRCLLLLRTSMAVMDYESDKIAAWRVPELNGAEKDDIMGSLLAVDPPEETHLNRQSARRWAHDNHTDWEESLRVPIRLAYLLKKSVHSQNERLTQDPIPWLIESKLLGGVDKFMSGFYDIRKQLTTVRDYFVFERE